MNQLELLKKYYRSNELILTKYDDTENQVETKLPNWYKRYIDIFDKSLINSSIKVHSPQFFEEFCENVYEVNEDVSMNNEKLNLSEYVPEEGKKKIIPFAELCDSQGIFFWMENNFNEVLFMDRTYQIIEFKSDFISLILFENNGLEKIGFDRKNWFEDFIIETNQVNKYIEFFIKHNLADYKKTRDLLLSLLPFDFKISKKNVVNNVNEIFDARRKSKCVFEMVQYEDTRVGITIRYPIEYYEKMFFLIKEMEKLHYYVTDCGNYYVS